MTGDLKTCSTEEDLVREAAERVTDSLGRDIHARGSAALVLSGGSTPRRLYALLGSREYRERIDWGRVHLFWGDERCVPPDHPESNFMMVNDAWLSRAGFPPGNVHRIRAELPPKDAAGAYEEEIRQVCRIGGNEIPRFSIVLLGLGQDGHTASLFPGSTALQECRKLVTELYVQSLNAWRVTMTLPVINNASTVLFLVSGSAKAGILKSVLEGGPHSYPAQLVDPADGQLLWFADAGASAELSSVNRA